jgi:RNA polymerase sigma factor for flagellar operon FliA
VRRLRVGGTPTQAPAVKRTKTPTILYTTQLWADFVLSHCLCHRDQLITIYYPVVRRVAGRIWKRTPSQVEFDELVSFGSIGLIRAVDRYDPYRGVSFETVAAAHIRGVIFDELRVIDWAPRSVRRRQRELDQAFESLEARLKCTPSVAELAGELDTTEADVMQRLRETEMAFIKPLDEPPLSIGSTDEDDVEDYRMPIEAADPADLVASEVLWASARGVLDSLPARARLVLALYYFEGLSLSDASKVMGVPEYKASQIHADAVTAVRDRLVEVVGAAA